jgi:putative ABC transport system permease protein
MIKYFFNYGLKNLFHRQMRSWLTILGVVIGIAAIVSLITVGAGLENAIVDQFSSLGADKIRIVPEGLTGPPAGVSGLTTDDVDTVEGVLGVDWVAPAIMNYATIEFDNQEEIMIVKGYPGDLAEDNKIDIDVDLVDGEWYGDGDTGVAVIGYSVAYTIYDEEIRLKNSIEINGDKYKVIGILEQIGDQGSDQVAYIPYDDAEDMFDMEGEVSFIVATVEEGRSIEEVSESVAKDLEKKRGNDNFSLFTPDQILEQLGSILAIVQFLLGGIAAVSLAVGGIGIMNSMYTSVLERTKEIGVMKAIGASRYHILSIFMVEAGLIGAVGGLLGVLLGNFFAFSVQGAASLLGFSLLQITLQWNVIFFALFFAFVIGMISGILPAYKASKLRPVEALRWE